MARKNTQRADSTEVFLFDSRTKAVMAQSTQDGIKEKLAAVREVVPGKSNTEICLVLQYYDYNVEQTIHSYLEDGAKDALQDWHYPSGKQPKKKKKKNKGQQQGAVNKDQGSTPQATSQTGSENTQGTSQASLDPSHADSIVRPVNISNNEATSTNAITGDTCNSYPLDVSGEDHITPECHLVPGTEYEDPTEVPPLISASGSSTEAASTSKGCSVPTSDEDAVPVSSLPVSVSVTVSASKLDTNSKSSLPSTQHRHPQPALSHASRPRNLDGRARDHGSSSPVVTPDTKSRRPHAGLEKSIKDLQRQTTSLQRLRVVLGEEIDRSYKKIKQVFEELHRELSEREAEVLFDMDKVKTEAVETLIRRQDKAFELKQKTDRAQTMNEQEVAELRADIKQFVSDRKIDEDLSRTTRFTYETSHLIENIRKFGDIAPVKNNYTQRRPSVSSISSSVVSHEDIQSPSTPVTPGTPLSASTSSDNFPAMQSTAGATSKLPVTSMTLQSDTMTAQELAELQQRLNTSMIKQGLPTKPVSPKRGNPSGARPRSATSSPAKTNTTNTDSEQSTDDAKKSRNARRRQRLRERQREARRAHQNESGQESESLSPAQPQRNSNSKPVQMSQGAVKPAKQRTPSPDKPGPAGDQGDRKDSRGRGQNQRSNQSQGFRPAEQGQRPGNRGPRQGSSPSKTNTNSPKPVLKGREGSADIPSSRPQEKGANKSASPQHSKPYVAKDNKPHRVEVSINSAQHSVPIDNREANGTKPISGNSMLNGSDPVYTPDPEQPLPQRKARNKVDKRRNVRLDQNGVVNGDVHDIHSDVVNGGTE